MIESQVSLLRPMINDGKVVQSKPVFETIPETERFDREDTEVAGTFAMPFRVAESLCNTSMTTTIAMSRVRTKMVQGLRTVQLFHSGNSWRVRFLLRGASVSSARLLLISREGSASGASSAIESSLLYVLFGKLCSAQQLEVILFFGKWIYLYEYSRLHHTLPCIRRTQVN
jgi:hypothetical protein